VPCVTPASSPACMTEQLAPTARLVTRRDQLRQAHADGPAAAQFAPEHYAADMAMLDAQSREEVVAMLKRNSTGFSRRSPAWQRPGRHAGASAQSLGRRARIKLAASGALHEAPHP